jgi:hypothetical protein
MRFKIPRIRPKRKEKLQCFHCHLRFYQGYFVKLPDDFIEWIEECCPKCGATRIVHIQKKED